MKNLIRAFKKKFEDFSSISWDGQEVTVTTILPHNGYEEHYTKQEFESGSPTRKLFEKAEVIMSQLGYS